MACVGDFFIWNFPNAGNPQKVQRYPEEWAARAARRSSTHEPELLLPAHGLPIAGRERIARVLDEAADRARGPRARRAGDDERRRDARRDRPHGAGRDDVLRLPYLRPLYDEPEFVVRNVWRRYGGWWDGNPAHLKPAPAAAVAAELAALAGGAGPAGDPGRRARRRRRPPPRLPPRRAGGDRGPDDTEVHDTRAALYERRRKAETSLMTKGIFAAAVRESRRGHSG